MPKFRFDVLESRKRCSEVFMSQRVLLCRSNCCPQLSISDDGKVGAISAEREKDDVYVDPSTVIIRFTRGQLQKLADELAAFGFRPGAND